MATKATVHQDAQGLFVRHGNHKVRPIPAGSDANLFSGEHNRYRQSVEQSLGRKICWDGTSAHQAGDKVLKTHHSQTIRCTIKGLDGSEPEIWFIHEELPKPAEPPMLEEYQRTAAPRNGVSYANYLALLELEKLNPPHHPRFTKTEGGMPFVTYEGTCAEYPRRSFQPNQRRAAVAYFDELSRHFESRHPGAKRRKP